MKENYHNPNDNWYYSQRYDLKSKGSMKGCFYSAVIIIVLLVVCLLFSSCKTQYIPVETVKTEYKTNTIHDSVFVEVLKHDSVVVAQKGDTVFVSKWHTIYKDRWRDKIVTDTIIKVDSIQVPYPVEKQLSTWEKFKMNMGVILMLAFILVLIIMLFKWSMKVKQML